jgi:hypothetical protein
MSKLQSTSSWWACSYPNQASWYAAAHNAEPRLKATTRPSGYLDSNNTGKFGDYWKKPRAEERPYVAEDVEVAA